MKLRNFLASITLLSCVACDKVPAGHVGVKVYLLGGEKGVDTEVLGVGKYWIGFNEDLYLFPTYQQNYTWVNPCPPNSQEEKRNGDDCKVADESIKFQTVEGMDVVADVGISYTLDPEKITTIFQKYRRGVDEITDTFLRNHVRDAMNAAGSKMQIESVYGTGKVTFMNDVLNLVRNNVKDIGINIDNVYLIGSLRLPASVVEALNAKMAATQRAQQRENEVREAEANAAKELATAKGKAESLLKVAEAEAKANEIVSKSLTSELVQYEQVKKWNGVMPTTVLSDKSSLIFSK